jgi:hypothetical protein
MNNNEQMKAQMAIMHNTLVAQNAELRAALEWFRDRYAHEYFLRQGDMHEPDCRCLRCAYDNACQVLGDK